jgi:hypothetical protein
VPGQPDRPVLVLAGAARTPSARRPALTVLGQQLADQAPELSAYLDAPGAPAGAPGGGLPVSLERPVPAAAGCVAAQLP